MVSPVLSEEVWIAFSREKGNALIDDCLPSTHPIEAECQSVTDAPDLLDGITYGKGAVFLRQLILIVGEDKFFEGCQHYFKRFAWGNTELQDFIDCIREKSQVDLTEFVTSWLKFSGCNAITATIESQESSSVLKLEVTEHNQSLESSLGDFAKYSKNNLAPCQEFKLRDQSFQVLRIAYDKENDELSL